MNECKKKIREIRRWLMVNWLMLWSVVVAGVIVRDVFGRGSEQVFFSFVITNAFMILSMLVTFICEVNLGKLRRSIKELETQEE